MRHVAGLSLALMFLAGGCAGSRASEQSLGGSAGGLLFNGYAKSDVTCYRCHNGNGMGSDRGPNLAKRVPTLTDDEIVATIDQGPGKMPSFKDKLDAEEKWEIVGWLRLKFGPKRQ